MWCSPFEAPQADRQGPARGAGAEAGAGVEVAVAHRSVGVVEGGDEVGEVVAVQVDQEAPLAVVVVGVVPGDVGGLEGAAARGRPPRARIQVGLGAHAVVGAAVRAHVVGQPVAVHIAEERVRHAEVERIQVVRRAPLAAEREAVAGVQPRVPALPGAAVVHEVDEAVPVHVGELADRLRVGPQLARQLPARLLAPAGHPLLPGEDRGRETLAPEAAQRERGEARAARARVRFVAEAILADPFVGVPGLEGREALGGRDERARDVPRLGVGAVLPDEAYGRVGRDPGGRVLGVVDARQLELAAVRILEIAVAHGVSGAVLHPGERPQPDAPRACRLGAAVAGRAVAADAAVAPLDAELARTRIGIRGVRAADGDDPRPALALGPVLRAGHPVRARDRDEPLAVEAEPVAAVEGDRADRAVAPQVRRAAADRRLPGEAEADPQRTVRSLAVVAQRELGLHAGGAGRNGDGNVVGRGAGRRHREASVDLPDQIGARVQRRGQHENCEQRYRPKRPKRPHGPHGQDLRVEHGTMG